MADHALVDPVGSMPKVCMKVQGIPYNIALTVNQIKNKAIYDPYNMLLGWPWLVAAKVTDN